MLVQGNVYLPEHEHNIDTSSTGGYVALGLGVKQWSVDLCADRFVRLCSEAFQPKPINKLVPERFTTARNRLPRYKTKPSYAVLQQQLGDDALYGKVPDDAVVRDNKVCVTTVPPNGGNAVAIGNYARQSEEEHWYRYERGDFLSVWQAAAATTAAPGYFKKFTLTHHQRVTSDFSTLNQFLDGSLYFNNPVRLAFNEHRFVWPDVAHIPPDIVLSLGTAQNAQMIETIMSSEIVARAPKSRTLCLPESKFQRLTKGFTTEGKKQTAMKNMYKALVRTIVCTLTLLD